MSADTVDQEFSFTNADFERVRKLIYGHAGISLHEGKKAMVYSRLSRRLRDTPYRAFAPYLDALERGPADAPEWQEFVNCLTTNLTSFFREEHHFHALAEELKPFQGKAVRIWCCAASTGEEPYSIAMICHESLRSMSQVGLVCSDIDTQVLATAKRGVYAADSRGLSAERLRHFFMRGTGANAGRIRFKPELAKGIDFRPLNLMHDRWNLGDPFHMVFCRNVMIYFDGPTQRKVLERIHRVMQPKGLLFVGHSENFTEAKDLFRLRGKTIYERV
ncbi:MAG: chemotaxis protein CheR [Burkholderiales bacterium]|uniref:CheR family methyltransferase n=1 Tax=Inhella sp. TaxID=1921806 RepID=UPI001AC6D2EE|nr:chemotaxis protein CheR [Burkholderiales bacterium]